MATNKPKGTSPKPDGADWARAELGRSLRRARLKAGLSQADLARKVRRSESMIAGAEAGTLVVSERYVASVLRACGLPEDWPAGDDENATEQRGALSAKKVARLAAIGGRVTTVKELFGLTDAESAEVELRVAQHLAARVKSGRHGDGHQD